jgi:tRNA (guanine26-N2/guanine27-N2)-dimethyltransferase
MEQQLPQEGLSTTIHEGKAKITLLEGQETVFYNRVQEFNRDLSVATIQLFEKIYRNEREEKDRKLFERLIDKPEVQETAKPYKGLTILEALSATGLRAIRYAKEIQGIQQVIANDYSYDAVEIIKKSVRDNELTAETVLAHFGDAK